MDHMPDDLTNDYHLFGFDGDEYLHRDLASVVEDRVFEERDDLAAAYCRMDDMEGLNDE